MKKSIIISLVVSVLFLVIGIFILANPHDDYVETLATVSRIEFVSSDIDRGDTYDTYVDYVANGQEYNDIRLDGESSFHPIGEQLKAFYNPEDPTMIETGGRGFMGILMTVIGALLLLFSVAGIFLPGVNKFFG